MKLSKTLALFGALAVLSVSAFAQRGQGGMRMMGMGAGVQPSWMLVGRADVQEDLKLSDEQKSSLEKLSEEMRATMMERMQRGGGAGGERPSREERQKQMAAMQKEMNDKLATVLTADQMKRVKEIGIQMAGAGAALNPEIGKELGITEAQKTKMEGLQTEMNRANRAVFERVQNQELDREAAMAKVKANSDALNVEFEKVLTAEQKAKLKTMGGAPFTRKDEAGK